MTELLSEQHIWDLIFFSISFTVGFLIGSYENKLKSFIKMVLERNKK